MSIPRTLPIPDANGCFWLGAKPGGPAIFPSGISHDNGRDVWFLCGLEPTRQNMVLMFDGPRLRYYGTPALAFAALLLSTS